MDRSLELVTDASAEPVTVDEFKAHAKIDITDDDTLILALLKAARSRCESITRRGYLSQTWKVHMSCIPSTRIFDIPMGPLLSIVDVTYYDEDDAQQTFNAANYILNTRREPGQILLADGASWPTLSSIEPMPMTIQFTCGYASGDKIPHEHLLMLNHLAAHWYENREGFVPATGMTAVRLPLPEGFKALSYANRIYTTKS